MDITLEWFPIVLTIKPKVIKGPTRLSMTRFLYTSLTLFLTALIHHIMAALTFFWFLKHVNSFLLHGLWKCCLYQEVSEPDLYNVLSILSFRSAWTPPQCVISWPPTWNLSPTPTPSASITLSKCIFFKAVIIIAHHLAHLLALWK